jgi:hypothetical protein
MLSERSRILAGLVIGLALIPCVAFGQVTTATITGTVRDAQGGIIPGATVVLTSDTRGVQVGTSITDATGNFIFPGTMPDTYSVTISLEGFKTKKTSGFEVSSGDRLALPPMTLEVGALSETVVVTGESPLIQAASGERSFTIPTQSVENLPISSRNFRDLALLTPGVIAGQNAGVMRIGGGGYANIMMDGISAMDTGNNGQMIAMNTEAVSEVKVLTSAYQAEYGRSSGIQVLSVTKGGTNRFRGSVYDVERNSNWNKNSWTNIQNGVAKTVSKQRDWGFSVGGPVGKPGGNNKVFFFFSLEERPRKGGNVEQTFRLPTDLERQGNFSQTIDNQGNPYPYVWDRLSGFDCKAPSGNTPAVTAGCFQDGGVLGKIPQNRLWAPGMALLNMYPMKPNLTQAPGTNFNTRIYTPTLNTLSYQPAVRVDYQVSSKLRVAFKMNSMNQNSGTPDQYGVVGGPFGNAYAIPGLNDSKGNQAPWITTYSASANYNIGSRTFLEAIYGHTQNYYESVSTAPLSNRNTAGLAGIPDIYTTNRDVNPDYFMAGALASIIAPFYVNGKIQLPQQINYGTRTGNIPSVPGYPGWLNVNQTWDFAASVTHVRGQHTIKGGVAFNHSFKAQNMTQAGLPMGTINFTESTDNPVDTNISLANIAIGSFNNYSQASKFVESGMVYLGVEPYIQDNWKLSNRFTLDYGLRFVHLQPEYDKYMQASNFFPEQWKASAAPALYQPACPNNVYPCATTARQAMNPVTGQLLGTGTSGLIGQAVPNTGSTTNGIVQQGKGIADTNFLYPTLKVAPRVGFAYHLTESGKWILRGGFGIFYDRMEGNFTMSQSANPPTAESTTLYYGDMRTVGTGVAAKGVPTLIIYRYNNPNLPSSAQWNVGTQMELPYGFTFDASYVGQYMYDSQGAQGGQAVTNLNQIELGAAYLAQNQDPTYAASAVPGQNAYSPNLLRYYKGYSNINQNAAVFHREMHGLQFSVQRRFSKGFSAGLNWNLTLMDQGNYSADYSVVQRMQHNADGTVTLRADQKQWEEMMKDQGTPTHIFKGNFVWDMPDLHASSTGGKVVGYIINDWQLSGVWTAQTGGGYSLGYGYQTAGTAQNLTGTPDIGARIKIIGDPGSGCSDNQYKQFNTAAVLGPDYYSNGMESGRNYMHGCFQSVWDLSLARNVRLGGSRNFQFRAEVYNALNSSTYTSRITTISYNNPTSKTQINPQYLPDGTVDPRYVKPNAAQFGAVNGTLAPLTVQLQIRFAF